MATVHTPRTLGRLLRDRRHELHRSQADVASSAGVSRQWLVEVEAGKPTAEVGLLLKVLDEVDLELDARVRRRGHQPDRNPRSGAVAVDLDDLLDDHRRR